jgi:hypothetical protein
VAIRITKKEGQPVHLVPEGTPGAIIVSVKKVNELDYYSLGLKDLADKASLNQPRALALVKHLDLQSSTEFFKEVRIGKVVFKRYSQKALEAPARSPQDGRHGKTLAASQALRKAGCRKAWRCLTKDERQRSAIGHTADRQE